MVKEGSVTVRAVPKEVSPEVLTADLEWYREKALKLGASQAIVIPSSYISVDERVRIKCLVPRCPRYGESPNCPPYTPDLEFVRKAFSQYSWAILFKTDMKPVSDYIARGVDREQERQRILSFHRKSSDIVCQIEGMACKDGYYLAAGFGGGSCKDYLCNGLVCQFLDSGKCRFTLRARPAMEGMGVDVFGLVTKIGWEVFPLASKEPNPEAIPCAISVGLVFIY